MARRVRNKIDDLPEREIDPATLATPPAKREPRARSEEPPPADPSDPGPEKPLDGPALSGCGSVIPSHPYNGLPPEAPVTALGHKDNDKYFFLATDGGLKQIRDEKFTQLKLISLYGGNTTLLEALWARVGKRGEVTGFDAHSCAGDHMMACHAAGPFDPVNAMRGAGAWRGPNGELIWNFGDRLLRKPLDGPDLWVEGTRKLGYHIYQLRPPMLGPQDTAATPEHAKELLRSLSTWNWARTELDPLLLLGWIVAAFFGGALTWRPLIWLTGERNTGKSTINGRGGYFDHIFGPDGVLIASNATGAGIYQHMGFDARPAALDEMEARADNRRNQSILDLALEAASGGVTLRGGADHTGIAFQSRSAFCFSSINIPAINSAMLSRLGILELGKLSAKDRSGVLSPEKLQAIGSALRRRIVDFWPQWDRRYGDWNAALMKLGHSTRTADQFGTLLAAAHLALEDEPLGQDEIVKRLEIWGLKHLAELADDKPDWASCVAHLLTQPLPAPRGQETTVARLIQTSLGWLERADADTNKAAESQRHSRDALTHLGLRLEEAPDPDRDGKDSWFLAVANDAQALVRLFAGSHWSGTSGATPVYVKTLRRVPGALFGEDDLRGKPTRSFNGHKSRVTLLPLEQLMPDAQDG